MSLSAELPQRPVRKPPAVVIQDEDPISKLTAQLTTISICDEAPTIPPSVSYPDLPTIPVKIEIPVPVWRQPDPRLVPQVDDDISPADTSTASAGTTSTAEGDVSTWSSASASSSRSLSSTLKTLTWADVCGSGPGTSITKIAEASYAEVYRVSNARGTSVIKAIRLAPPDGRQDDIKPQTAAQRRWGLVDEEAHAEADVAGELRVSSWLAHVPGFVVYKERYIVRGRCPANSALLRTHQEFQRRAKKRDPNRLQFYPSPSRYLDETRFLVVELGDAGTALEDWRLETLDELWDVFLLVTLALARAEVQVRFEHRDLHEGNLCIRRVGPRSSPSERPGDRRRRFGFSGLDVTILDYGLSRASKGKTVVAPDLSRDPALFASTHAPQCAVYRRMREAMLVLQQEEERQQQRQRRHESTTSDATETTATSSRRRAMPDDNSCSSDPYATIDWGRFNPYTNVLWLAYIYGYLTDHFCGSAQQLVNFRRETLELARLLDPDTYGGGCEEDGFLSASEVVTFAVDRGWLGAEQVVAGPCGADATSPEASILSLLSASDDCYSEECDGNVEEPNGGGMAAKRRGEDDSAHVQRRRRRGEAVIVTKEKNGDVLGGLRRSPRRSGIPGRYRA